MKRIKALLSIILLLCFVALQTAAAKPFTVVIDAGHGGNDPGAIGQITKEKIINLNVALALGKIIESNCADVKVVYTRKTDVFVSLQGRANIANKAKADLFISIHTNSAPGGSTASGAETYTLGMHRAADNLAVARRENSVITMESNYKQTYAGFDPNKAESYIIFELMQDKYMAQSVKLAQCIQKQYASAGRRNKGVHQAGFLVLRETSMPSILTELGFISNATEEAFLNSEEGVQKMAQSIYEGFCSYRRQLAEVNTSDQNIIPQQAVAHDIAAANTQQELHSSEGATPGNAPDVIPSIRPVKVVPYPTTTASASTVTTAPVTEQDKPETSTPEKPKAQPAPEKPKAQPAPEKPKAQPAPEKPKAQQAPEKPKAQPATVTGKPEFRLQLFTSTSERKAGDASFKGLDVSYYKDGNTYKYTYGSSCKYEEILALKKEVSNKFPGVFVIAILDGKRIDLQQAINLSKQK